MNTIADTAHDLMDTDQPMTLKQWQICHSWMLSEFYYEFFPAFLTDNGVSLRSKFKPAAWKLLWDGAMTKWEAKKAKEKEDLNGLRPTITMGDRNILYVL